MCDSPILVKNPNFRRKVTKDSAARFLDCTSQYIRVPCGHCKECIANKQMQLVQRIQAESFDNYLFFCTLTYNNESLPILEVNGHSIRYFEVSDLQNMFKRLRKYDAFGRPFRYLAVSELGTAKGRPHAHIVFLVPKYSTDTDATPYNLEKIMFDKVLFEWRRNYGSSRSPDYRSLCTYVRYWKNGKLSTNFDLHYVVPFNGSDGSSNVGFYVLKYMLKPSSRAVKLQQALKLNLDESDYGRIWSKVRPRYFSSLKFGLAPDGAGNPSPKVVSYIKNSVKISQSVSEFPCFFNPDTGAKFPLARYYRNKGYLYSVDDAKVFYDKSNHSSRIDSINDSPVATLDQCELNEYQLSNFRKIAFNGHFD